MINLRDIPVSIFPDGHKHINAAGFKWYGDSITLDLARKINQGLKEKGFASINWVAGIGSFTYQYNTRDTFGSAIKATFGVVNGENREIFKDPKTDNGTKKSAKGLIAVYYDDTVGTYVKEDQVSWKEVMDCAYITVFQNGELLLEHSLEDIRNRLKRSSQVVKAIA